MSEEIRSAGAIRQKAQQIAYRYLKRILSDNLGICPYNCKWRREVPIGEIVPTNICLCPELDETRFSRICDYEQSKICGCFTPKKSKEELKAEFKELIEKAPLAFVAKEYPDLAALLWVLQEDRELEIPEDALPGGVLSLGYLAWIEEAGEMKLKTFEHPPQVIAPEENVKPEMTWKEWLQWPYRRLFL